MRRWTYMLGGLIAWTAHFSGLYAITSLDAQTAARDTQAWQAAAVALSVICAAACAGLAAAAARRVRRGREAAVALFDQLALAGAALALIAIAWQSLAVLIG